MPLTPKSCIARRWGEKRHGGPLRSAPARLHRRRVLRRTDRDAFAGVRARTPPCLRRQRRRPHGPSRVPSRVILGRDLTRSSDAIAGAAAEPTVNSAAAPPDPIVRCRRPLERRRSRRLGRTDSASRFGRNSLACRARVALLRVGRNAADLLVLAEEVRPTVCRPARPPIRVRSGANGHLDRRR